MAKGSRPDKQNQVMGMFSKMAREADRLEKRRIKEAKKRGEFYYISHPELLSITEQEKYFKAKDEFENGGPAWSTKYVVGSKDYPYPYNFAKKSDK